MIIFLDREATVKNIRQWGGKTGEERVLNEIGKRKRKVALT